jgi:indolepyruvate ferredoxin oxidoreductase beta subunit
MKYDLLLVGVGGQGIITLSELVGKAAVKKGIKVAGTQDKGLAQRGGSIKAHVRLGSAYSPMIPKFAADAIVSLEIAETLRCLDYVNETTTLLVDTKRIIAKDDLLKKEDEMSPPTVKKILANYQNVHFVDSGSKTRATNVFMLGVLQGFDRRLTQFITADEMKETVKTTFTQRATENMEAFEQGITFGRELRKLESSPSP